MCNTRPPLWVGPVTRPRVFVSYPGGAGHVLALAGADAALRSMADILGVSKFAVAGLPMAKP